MPDLSTITAGDILVLALTFLLAGGVKGVIGMGLPTVSLAILTLIYGLPEAMGLLLVPSFVTNLWQALAGGQLGQLSRRLWTFLIPAALLIWPGVWLLSRLNAEMLATLLGVTVILYAVLGLRGLRLTLRPATRQWTSPLAGGLTGLLTGMTGSFVVPGVLYLQSVGLDRHQLVQAMGMLFFICTLVLAAGLQSVNLLSSATLTLSASAVLPALIGMVAGQWLRKRLSEQSFRRIFFGALIIIGLALILQR